MAGYRVDYRLSGLCELLVSHRTPSLAPQESADILLRKYTPVDVESVLLQVSTLRSLYSHVTTSLSSPSPLPAGEGVLCGEAVSGDGEPGEEEKLSVSGVQYAVEVLKCLSCCLQELIQYVAGHLESDNQFISFCASKALVHVLLYSGVKEENILDFYLLLKSSLHSYVGVYSLQTMRELLKTLRKRCSADSSLNAQASLSVYFKTVSDRRLWLEAVDSLISEASRASSQCQREKLELIIGEFFSLTVEMMRHWQPLIHLSPSVFQLPSSHIQPPTSPALLPHSKPSCRQSLTSSPSTHTSLSPHMQCIVENLPKLFSLVQTSRNVFLFKKFIDISQKAVAKACPALITDCVLPSLKALLALPFTREIAVYWLKECSIPLLPVCLSRQLARMTAPSVISLDSEALEAESPEVCELVGTAIRKLTVLSLQCVSGVLCAHFSRSADFGDPSITVTALESLLTACKDLLSPPLPSNSGGGGGGGSSGSGGGGDGGGDSGNGGSSGDGGGGGGGSGGGGSCSDGSHEGPDLLRCVLFHIVSEEDGCLLQTLQASSLMWSHSKPIIGNSSSSLLDSLLTLVNPHTVWLLFLKSISFDHFVLLDLLLTAENDFKALLIDYLQLVSADWEAFQKICSENYTFYTLHNSFPTSSGVETSCAVNTSSSQSSSEGCVGGGEDCDYEFSRTESSESDRSPARKLLKLDSPDHPSSDLPPSLPLVEYSSSSSSSEEMITSDGGRLLHHCITGSFTQLSPFSALHSYSSSPAAHMDSVLSAIPFPSHLSYFPPLSFSSLKASPSTHYVQSPLHTYSSPSHPSVTPPHPSPSPPHPSPPPPPPSVPSESLDRMMGCFIRLCLALERLREGNLLPPDLHCSASSIIKCVARVEQLYES